MNNKPTMVAWVAVIVFIALLVGGGFWLSRSHLHEAAKQANEVDLNQARQVLNSSGEQPLADDTTQVASEVTSVDDYRFIDKSNLPSVQGASAYDWNANDPTINWPISMWAGWLPIVAANGGFEPNSECLFYEEAGVKVNISTVTDPVAARDGFATGDFHILWARSLDMMVLFAPELMRDSRTAPRVVQQIDWSSGGDGIIVRDHIKSVSDLEGATVTYAQNSPSEYYLNHLLVLGDVQPNRVSHHYTNSPYEAAHAFVVDEDIDAVVSWAPDIYNIVDKISGTKILSTTADAGKMIADIWAVRADFSEDHPEVVRGLVTAIFKAMERMEDDPDFKEKAIQWMAEGYEVSVDDVEDMLPDAHLTNFAENKAFFLDGTNPTNFARTWEDISYVYELVDRIDDSIPFDKVMDGSHIRALEQSGMFSDQEDVYSAVFTAAPQQLIGDPLLTKAIRIHFAPNKTDPLFKTKDGRTYDPDGVLYDPKANEAIETIARLAGQHDRYKIEIVGHADRSREGEVPEEWIIDLSRDRAKGVVETLMEKYDFPENKFTYEGKGWSESVNPDYPNDHDSNRRVEITIKQPEAEQ